MLTNPNLVSANVETISTLGGEIPLPPRPVTIDPETGKMIIFFDASLLKKSGCMLKLWLTGVCGYKSKLNSNDIEYGSAFHKFRAEVRESGDMGKGIQKALGYFRNKPMHVKPKKEFLKDTHLVGVCLGYWEKYKSSNHEVILNPETNRPLLEHRFTLPYLSTDKYDILLSGTIDEICKVQNGGYLIVDAKTTSRWNSDEYLRMYELSTQMLFYRFIIKRYAELYPSSIFSLMHHTGIACMIDGIFLKSNVNEVEFKRSRAIVFKERMLEEFEKMLNNKIDELWFHLNMLVSDSSYLPEREGLITGACEEVWGPCAFFNACSAPDDTAREHAMKAYKQEPYNPLLFGE